MFPFALESLLGLIKALLATYDVVTLPVYVVFQKPWVFWIRKRSRFAEPMIEGDPTSPYRRLRFSRFQMVEDVKTLDELARKAIRLFSHQPAIGTRPVLSCSEKHQSGGKVFKQLTLGDYEWLTYDEVDRKIDHTIRGLHSIGIRPRQFLAILAETRVEWFITAQACFRANVQLVTLYATLSNEGEKYEAMCAVLHVTVSLLCLISGGKQCLEADPTILGREAPTPGKGDASAATENIFEKV